MGGLNMPCDRVCTILDFRLAILAWRTLGWASVPFGQSFRQFHPLHLPVNLVLFLRSRLFRKAPRLGGALMRQKNHLFCNGADLLAQLLDKFGVANGIGLVIASGPSQDIHLGAKALQLVAATDQLLLPIVLEVDGW